MLNHFKHKAEDYLPETLEEFIGVDDVESLNDMAHEVAVIKAQQYTRQQPESQQQPSPKKKRKNSFKGSKKKRVKDEVWFN